LIKSKKLRATLDKYKIRYIYASPTKRALNTALLIFKNKKIILSKNLREKKVSESLKKFSKRVANFVKKIVKKKGVVVIISHNNTINQIIGEFYKINYKKVNIQFPFGSPLELHIKNNKIVFFTL
jgi:broad specificity phosphatase PhoE